MPPVPDEQLMADLQKENGEALRVLFDRHHQGLFSYLSGRLAEPDASEDLAQEVFIRVWRYRDTYDTRRAFLPWLYRIARNVLSNAVRKPNSAPTIAPRPPAPPAPDALLERKDEVEKVREAVRDLPPAQSEVLLLSRWSGMTYREIGEVVGCSEGAVKVRVFRAMESLRSSLRSLREDVS